MSTEIKNLREKLKKDFFTHNDEVEEPNNVGGSLQGYITISYDKLVEKLGEPHGSDGYKSDAEWEIFTEEHNACIYNWKNGKNYMGSDGSDVEDIRHWHIGGPDRSSVSFIKRIFPSARITRM